jgi:hypothetical protein
MLILKICRLYGRLGQWRATFQNLGMAINRVIFLEKKMETNFYWIVCVIPHFFGVCIIY